MAGSNRHVGESGSRVITYFFALCLSTIVILGTSLLATILVARRSVDNYLVFSYAFSLISVLLIFFQYTKNPALARRYFTLLPCKLGNVRIWKVFLLMLQQTEETCHRCRPFQVVFIFLAILTGVSSAFWFQFYDLVVGTFGLSTYAVLVSICVLAMPTHSTMIAMGQRRGSDSWRAITSIGFAFAPYLLAVLLLRLLAAT